MWKYEVDTLRKSQLAPPVIEIAVRRSLKGEAARVAMRLGSEASLDELLNKLETIYGLSIQNDKLMEEFYSSKQRPGEDVISWANRLEDLLYKAKQRHMIQETESNSKLCSMFWSGLNKDLKSMSGHLHFIVKDFDILKQEMRQIEADMKREEKSTTSKMASTRTNESKDDDELKAMIQRMATDIEALKKDRDRQYKPQQWQRYEKGQYKGQGNRQFNNQGNNNNRPRQKQNDRANNYDDNEQHQEQPRQDEPYKDVICWRCHQKGHLKIGCRVRLDHSRKALNGKRST